MNNRVTIVDIDIPFWRIVGIILKWTLASIPAAIIIWLVFFVLSAIFGAFLGIGGLLN